MSATELDRVVAEMLRRKQLALEAAAMRHGNGKS